MFAWVLLMSTAPGKTIMSAVANRYCHGGVPTTMSFAWDVAAAAAMAKANLIAVHFIVVLLNLCGVLTWGVGAISLDLTLDMATFLVFWTCFLEKKKKI